MPEYLSPGVYVEDTGFRFKSIGGASTSTAVFIGETETGPVKPHLVKSFRCYQELFGGVFDDKKYMPYAVRAFFDNGGRQCFIARVVPSLRGAPSVADFEGVVDDKGGASALAALSSREFDETAIINAPAAPVEVVRAVISHCEDHRFRFAVIDSPMEVSDPAHLDPRSHFQTSYAAYYYPWLMTEKIQSRGVIPTPPGGAVCGVYARTDGAQGVYKAPAAQELRNVTSVVRDISKESNADLNTRGVNTIRDLGPKGVQVWGARTLSMNPELRYVSVRRYLIYLERSIEQGARWAVFEPNDERLWARIRNIIGNFLYTEWRSGALLGGRPQEAYFVRCDRTTMTQSDISNGRLVYDIGVALLKPAEFVILRINQITTDDT